MKMKPLLLVLILLIMSTLTVISVQADTGKGTDKLYFEINYFVAPGSATVRTAPPNSTTPNVLFTSLISPQPRNFTVKIGSNLYYPNWTGTGLVIRNLDQSFSVAKLNAIITFNGVDGTLELSIRFMSHNPMTPNQVDNGTVVGHGTGYFEGVKILATYSADPANTAHKLLIGTIMGWPGLPKTDLTVT